MAAASESLDTNKLRGVLRDCFERRDFERAVGILKKLFEKSKPQEISDIVFQSLYVVHECLRLSQYDSVFLVLEPMVEIILTLETSVQSEIINLVRTLLSVNNKEVNKKAISLKEKVILKIPNLQEKYFTPVIQDEKKEAPAVPVKKNGDASAPTVSVNKNGDASALAVPVKKNGDVTETFFDLCTELKKSVRSAKNDAAIGITPNYKPIIQILSSLTESVRHWDEENMRNFYEMVILIKKNFQNYHNIRVREHASKFEVAYRTRFSASSIPNDTDHVVRNLARRLISEALGPPPTVVEGQDCWNRRDLVAAIENEIYTASQMKNPVRFENQNCNYAIFFKDEDRPAWNRYRDKYTAVVANLSDINKPNLAISLYIKKISAEDFVSQKHVVYEAKEDEFFRMARIQRYGYKFHDSRFRSLNPGEIQEVENIFTDAKSIYTKMENFKKTRTIKAEIEPSFLRTKEKRKAIDSYLADFSSRSRERLDELSKNGLLQPPRVHIFNSSFYTDVCAFDEKENKWILNEIAAKNATKNLGFNIAFDIDLLVVPICEKQTLDAVPTEKKEKKNVDVWTCVVVDFRVRTVRCYNGNNSKQHAENVLQIIMQERKKKPWPEEDFDALFKINASAKNPFSRENEIEDSALLMLSVVEFVVADVNFFKGDIRSLRTRISPTKTVVDYYLTMLSRRATKRFGDIKEKELYKPPRVHIFNSSFYTDVYAFDEVEKKWTLNEIAAENATKNLGFNIAFDIDLLVVPIVQDVITTNSLRTKSQEKINSTLWTCVVADFRTRKIRYYIGEEREKEHVLNVMQFIMKQALKNPEKKFNTKWTLDPRAVYPKPENYDMKDSALYMLSVVDFVIADVKFTFSLEDVDFIRKRMVLEITDGNLF